MSKCNYRFEDSELYNWLMSYFEENGNISDNPIKLKHL